METNNHEDQWVSSRLAALTPEWNADLARGRVLWADKSHAPRHSSKWIISATVTAGICIAALLLPQTRAIAHELWDRLVLRRVEVVRVDLSQLPLRTQITTNGLERSVSGLWEAEQSAGFKPYLPSPSVLNQEPSWTVTGPVAVQQTIHVRDLESALVRLGATDVQVPPEWEGVTLQADIGPSVMAKYPGNLRIVQGKPVELRVPSGFALERFAEAAFRSIGVPWRQARAMGREFAAHPAWFIDIPASEAVRIETLELRNGPALLMESRGGNAVIVRSTDERVYFVSSPARELSSRIAADLP